MTSSAQPEAVNALTCFVIGPIGDRMAPDGSRERETYEESLRVISEVVEPACARVGLTPVRADSIARAGEITEQVFRRLRDDDVVIADLTGANANVMYELGLRHTRNKLTVQIGEYGRLPFDVNVIRTIQFSRSPMGLITARDELQGVLEAGLLGDFDTITATRLWQEAHGPRDEVTSEGLVVAGPPSPETSAPEPEALEDGILDIMARGEEKLEELEPALQAVNRHIVALGDLAETSTEELARSDAAGLGMKGRLQVTTRHAAALDEIADELERDVARYAEVLGAVSDAYLVLIKDLEANPERLDEPDTLSFGMTVRWTAASNRDSMASLGGMVSAIRNNARLSRVLREPSARLTAALDAFGESTSIMDEWDRRLQVLGVPKPPEGWEPPTEEEDGDSETEGGG